MTDTTLDPKILNKNLEITRITKQLDDLTSEIVELKEQCREQTPMHMLDTLERCQNILELQKIDIYSKEELNGLNTDLKQVIKFLQQ
tara:strand:+ start:227 stop:487 length:261 start_codon:yes stop_codon:yes gene_type:complete